MPLCEFEKTITCPYNPSHQITEPRMGFHLTKCRKNHPDMGLAVCPFNSLHHIPKPEERFHMETCADRKSVELLKFRTEDEKPVAEFCLPNVTVNRTDTPNDEDWEAETVAGTYNPQAKAASKKVLRKIEGATPSQRKEFRRQERERLGRLSQGLSLDSFDLDQTQSIPGLATSQQSSEPGPPASQRRDSHLLPLRRPTIVQESVKPLQGIETQLLKVHLGRGMETPAQRMAGRKVELRRPGDVKVELAVGASNASEDGGSSTTSYSDVNANRLITMARGRGLQILKGVKKPGGLMETGNNVD